MNEGPDFKELYPSSSLPQPVGSKQQPATSARRDFILGSLAALPAAGLLGVGATHVAAAAPPTDTSQAPDPHHSCHDEAVRKQRSRWLQLVDAHVGRENLHDLPGIMDTFAANGEMIINDRPFVDPQSIAEGHALFGMSSMSGSLANTQVIPEREYFTDEEVLVEGRVVADHVGDILQFPATGRRVELHYSAFYRFDHHGELVSERVVMNWAPLAGA